MAQSTHPTTRSETMMGILILIGLAWIGYLVFEQQFKFNAALLIDTASSPAAAAPLQTPAPIASPMSNFLPENLAPLSAPENFNPDTLSDKIDGRAELYLSAGVVGLQCQRFARPDDPSAWIEVSIYDMGGARNAFAVYGIQRREDSQDIDVADFAYKTPNALFFVRGKYYVELVAAAVSEQTSADMEALAKRFCDNFKGDRKSVPEAGLFPTDGLIPGSMILYMKDGLGFEKFDSLFIASYKVGESEATAFLTVRKTDAEAADLVKAYAAHLLANGGVEEQTAGADSWARLFNLFGTYELVFANGPTVAGVHEADKVAAEKLGSMLLKNLGGKKP
jgi:hypothetical protein